MPGTSSQAAPTNVLCTGGRGEELVTVPEESNRTAPITQNVEALSRPELNECDAMDYEDDVNAAPMTINGAEQREGAEPAEFKPSICHAD